MAKNETVEMDKMARDNKRQEVEVDFGVGKMRFSGLFKGIGNLIDLASKLGDEAEEIKGGGEIRGLPRQAKGVYGFSIRTLVGGRPVVETFGNIKDTPKGPVVEEVREPLVDIFDERGRILLVAELPGVDEKDIKIEIEGDILKLTATGKGHKYAREVLLPARVNSETMKSTYKNGVLEIHLRKSKAS